MSKFKLSDNFLGLLQEISRDNNFKKLQYYMRCLKKAPHGGVFYNTHQSAFLKYYPVIIYTFLSKGNKVPYPVECYKETARELIAKYDISIEELMVFCFCIDVDDNSLLFGKKYAGERMFSAMASGVLSLKEGMTSQLFEVAVGDAVNGQIKFTDYFNCDFSRLLDVFLLWCINLNLAVFSKIEDVINVEELQTDCDKYGLNNVTSADFERQGFVMDNRFYLYNIFFDTSVGSAKANTPKIIEILQNSPCSDISIFMRKDKTLSVSKEKKIISATVDMQKWRGITVNLADLESQIKFNKETTVHFDPQTMHKVISVIKPAEATNHELYYHITVEQLWAPESLCQDENVVLTNFIHGCYYPKNKSFDHMDFSVNQYEKEMYIKKYQDSVVTTSVSIEQYSDFHYKVWCIKGSRISLKLWAELVFNTLDEPFRELFAEIIGAKWSAEE